MILFDVMIAAKDGQVAAMRELLRETMLASQRERGCLVYRFSTDLDEENRFYLVELWETEAALMAHASGAPFRYFLQEMPALGRVVSSVARSGPLEPFSFKRPVA